MNVALPDADPRTLGDGDLVRWLLAAAAAGRGSEDTDVVAAREELLRRERGRVSRLLVLDERGIPLNRLRVGFWPRPSTSTSYGR